MTEATYCGLGVVRAFSASMRLIGSSRERSSTPAVAGPTCQMRMKCTIISSVCQGGVASTTSWPSSVEQLGRRTCRSRARRVDRHRRRRLRRQRRSAGDRAARRPPRETSAPAPARRRSRRARCRVITSSSAAASRTVRAIGPEVPSPSEPETNGAGETRPRDGLMPKSPQHEAGMRIEPPPSLACATGARPAATAAAAPPLEPPGVRVTSHGLWQSPFSSDSVIAIVPNSGVFVLPMIVKPASRIFRTTDASKSGTLSSKCLAGVGRPDARGLVEILDRDRDSVERPVARCRRLVDDGDVGVQLRVEPLDPLEVVRGQLCGRDLMCTHALRQLERGRERELVTHRLRPVSHFQAKR